MTAIPPPMAGSTRAPGDQLRAFEPFDRLSAEAAAAIEPLLEPRRYRMGQTLLRPDALPEGVLLLLRGQLRSLGPHPSGQGLRTIARLEPLHWWVGSVCCAVIPASI